MGKWICLAIFAFTPAYAETITERLNSKPVITGAHQGGTFTPDSNTLAQFKRVIAAGIDIIETDLRPTLDGVPVVLHDSTLDKKTNCTGPVNQKTYAEIQRCKVEFSQEHIPSFEQVLKWVNGRAIINAEFKTDDVIVAAIDLVKKYNAYEWVFFQTRANQNTYYQARSYDNYVALLYKTVDLENLQWAIALNDPRLIVIEMEKKMIIQKHIQIAHGAGKFILTDTWRYVWHKEIAGAACTNAWKRGADIGISNAPNQCIAQAKKWKP